MYIYIYIYIYYIYIHIKKNQVLGILCSNGNISNNQTFIVNMTTLKLFDGNGRSRKNRNMELH